MVGSRMVPSRKIERLIEIMAALRRPGSGCPWDLEQTFRTVAPYTIEEAYEVADAIERGDLDDLRDELGDLLLQVVFHARMAEEAGAFAFGDVVAAITTKLIRRHPHVFDEARDLSPDEVKGVWDAVKAAERSARAQASHDGAVPSLLDGIAQALPALIRAEKLTRKAATVGFDWPETAQVVDKIHEEIAEVADAVAGGEPERIEDEVGDLLFAAANLARHLKVDAEGALRRANAKFERRFQAVERGLADRGRSLNEASLEEMEQLWSEAKAAERTGHPRQEPGRSPGSGEADPGTVGATGSPSLVEPGIGAATGRTRWLAGDDT
jgi:nucleoside triphosphate diphosphatase